MLSLVLVMHNLIKIILSFSQNPRVKLYDDIDHKPHSNRYVIIDINRL